MKKVLLILVLVFGVYSLSAQTLSKTSIELKASQIDRMLEKEMVKAGVRLMPKAGDDMLVRRTYLDIIGRIPTAQEARDFILSPRSDKHSRLIDRLMKSDGYISHNFNYWADILRAVSRVDGGGNGETYLFWIKEALAQKMPYDKFVQTLLSAEGSPYDKGNGAVGYYLRDPGMPLDNMANTVQVFLGTRIGCAQCHDHPFDRWTQMDFYKLSAFTGGINTRNRGNKKAGMVKKLLKNEDRKLQQSANRLLREMSYGVSGSGTGQIKLPATYAYTDAKPGEKIKAAVPFGDQVKIPMARPTPAVNNKNKKKSKKSKKNKKTMKVPEVNSREHFANWVSSKDNPRFTLTIANRIWKKVMGLGLIEPVDDINDKTKAANPELMAFLEELMKECKYDLRTFQAVLFNTKSYKAEALEKPLKPNEKYLYQGPIVKRLKSEQVWDSLVGLVVPQIDGRKSSLRTNDMYELLKNKPAEQIAAYTKKVYQDKIDGKKAKDDYNRLRKSLDIRKRKIYAEMKKNKNDKKKVESLKRDLKQVNTKLQQARAALPKREKKSPKNSSSTSKVYAKYSRNLMRASELPSPSKPGHFLRQFGQSQRDTIDNASQDATVTQVLNLLNGFVDKNLINNSRSVILQDLAQKKTAEDKLNSLYLSLYSRYPALRERMMMLAHIKKTGNTDQSYKDIVWAMINTNEFMFRR
jgi:hypothetical protein